MPRFFRLTSILAILLLPVVASTQETSSFSDVVDVELVNVEVWVTDRSGDLVTGLTVEDFEIQEDGDPVEIAFFAEVGTQLGEIPVEDLMADSALAGDAPSLALVLEPVDPPSFVVYLDETRLQPQSRKRIADDVRAFLADGKVAPERVLVVRQDTEGVHVDVPFDSGFTEIDAALVRLVEQGSRGSSLDDSRRLTYSRLRVLWDQARVLSSGSSGAIAGAAGNASAGGAAPCDWFVRQAANEIRVFSNESRARIGQTLQSLADSATLLAGVDGVKTLLYLSDGLETDPGLEMVSFVESLCPTARQEQDSLSRRDDLSSEFLALTSHANTNRVTIYTMQASGLQPSYLSSAEQESIGSNAGKVFDDQVRINQRDGLLELALETGGRAIYNQNDLSSELVQMGREMTSYYSLAYTPPNPGTERQHKIKVKVRSDVRKALGKKLEVRHRRAYRDKTADQRMAERLQSAVRLGVIKNYHGARLAAGTLREGSESDKAKYTLPLHIMVPAEHITFLPGESGSAAQIRLRVTSTNAEGKTLDYRQRTFRFDAPVSSEEQAEALLDLSLEIGLGDGVNVVAAAVRDEASGEASYVATSLEVGGSASP